MLLCGGERGEITIKERSNSGADTDEDPRSPHDILRGTHRSEDALLVVALSAANVLGHFYHDGVKENEREEETR